MITAVSDINQISDRCFKARTFRGGYVDVFVNPSQSELVKVASKKTNRIRYTADARSPQKVWVWDASKSIHYEMLPLLGGDRCDVYPYILGGVSELQGPNAVMCSATITLERQRQLHLCIFRGIVVC
jgi:hypothetical protein